MKPIESLTNELIAYTYETKELAKYESHHHHQDEDAMPGTTGEPQND